MAVTPTPDIQVTPDIKPAVPSPTPETRPPLPGVTVENPKLEMLNNLQDIRDALQECAKTLVQINDGPGVLLVAEAAQCGETPMGLELQYNVLDMMRHLSSRKFDNQVPLMLLRQKLGKLQYPDKPPTAHMTKFIEDHKDAFPRGYEPTRLALMLNTGETSVLTLANQLKGNEAFAALKEPYLEAVMGRNFNALRNPAYMLGQVGLSDKDITKVMTMGSPHGGFDSNLAVTASLLGGMFLIQMIQENSGNPPAGQHLSAH